MAYFDEINLNPYDANYDFSFLDNYFNKILPTQTQAQDTESEDQYEEQQPDEEDDYNFPDSEENLLNSEDNTNEVPGGGDPVEDFLFDWNKIYEPMRRAKATGEIGLKGSIAESHNNPGNLKYANWMQKFGAIPGKPGKDGGRFAYFPDIDSGFAARSELFKRPLYSGKTVDSALKLYSNNGYDGSIYPQIRNKKLSELTDEELKELTRRQVKREDVNFARKLGIKQTGGIADTKESQYIGLNDNSLDELFMPITGNNTIRGLDSGEPVLINDEFGNVSILYGPDDTIQTNGSVYEKRLKYGKGKGRK